MATFLLPVAPPVGGQRLAGQRVGRDDEHTVRNRIQNIDHLQIPARLRLAQGDPASIDTLAIFAGVLQHLAHLVGLDLVVLDVGPSGDGVDVESDVQDRTPILAHATLLRKQAFTRLPRSV